ncbi:O(6)-methylguanine-induced apoptosis 2 [Accipiter gentilis]|uniref:O(6)-methylguanine-induced apoptosis 2 n=1 Tax=Astur gentilis TaxID=8957 RepID=UPI00210F6AF6|nr:O(6)-methylguanine-induced apoptosis 2 [Accipiter gentilis]
MSEKLENETPGPGFYSVTHQSAEINGTSLSKKGTAYFPSLVTTTSTIPSSRCLPRTQAPEEHTGHKESNLGTAGRQWQEFCLTPSAPAIPPCKDPPSPGPGQYNPVDYKGSPKQDCSKQTVLVSNTGRWTQRQ